MPKVNVRATPLIENKHVKELLSLTLGNQLPSMKKLLDVLNQVTAMEKQLETALQELSAMRRELAEMENQKHPLKNAMQKAVIVMQGHVLELREKLNALKQSVIDGCKNTVAAIKEKGITVFDDVARFFKVKPMFEAIRISADRAADSVDKAINSIENASAKYHEAGRRVKNAGRALAGKENVKEAKSNGNISKTFTAPFRATRSCFVGIKNHAMTAVDTLKRLEEQATERKPSIKKAIQDYDKQIVQTARAAPVRERSTHSTEL